MRGRVCSSAEENKINTETCWEAATGEIKWERTILKWILAMVVMSVSEQNWLWNVCSNTYASTAELTM